MNADAIKIYLDVYYQRAKNVALNLKLVIDLMQVYEVKDKEKCLRQITLLEGEFGGER